MNGDNVKAVIVVFLLVLCCVLYAATAHCQEGGSSETITGTTATTNGNFLVLTVSEPEPIYDQHLYNCDTSHCSPLKTWGEEQDEMVKKALEVKLVCEVKKADGFCQSGHLSDGRIWAENHQ